MDLEVVTRGEFKAVGVGQLDADRRSHLILNLWASLRPKPRLVERQVEPHVLIGHIETGGTQGCSTS